MFSTGGGVFQFDMCRLEQLCVQYLEAAINQRNVLVALENASSLQLNYIKEFCLRCAPFLMSR